LADALLGARDLDALSIQGSSVSLSESPLGSSAELRQIIVRPLDLESIQPFDSFSNRSGRVTVRSV
jgi:hypothetical protein